MPDVIQFVDSIVASPTVRLDLNVDPGGPFKCRVVEFRPAPLRYAMSDNAMSDGAYVSSSTYGPAQLTLTLDLVTSTQDLNATSVQALVRELNRETNILKYQPAGATKPVFFNTARASMESIQDVLGATAYRQITVPLMVPIGCALGLRETIAVGTVNNDPAAGSNGCFFDVTGVIGDIPAPCVIVDDAGVTKGGYWGLSSQGTPSDAVFVYQAEGAGWTTITNLTNPGGAADAVMSGSTSTNYLRSTAASVNLRRTITGTDAERLARAGKWRVFVAWRKTTSGDNWSFTVDMSTVGYVASAETTTLNSGQRYLFDLGVVDFGGGVQVGGATAVVPSSNDVILDIFATRTTGGATTLDLDFVMFLPAKEAMGVYSGMFTSGTTAQAFDSFNQAAYNTEIGGDLFAGARTIYWPTPVSGSFINLQPSRTNRVYWIRGTHSTTAANVFAMPNTATSSLTVSYWPRYIFIRPSAT